MANITAEQLAEVINILSKKDEPKQEEPQEEPKEEQKPEEPAKPEEPKQEEPKPEEEEPAQAEDTEAVERENRFIEKSLAAEMTKAGLDTEVVSGLSEYLDYGTLKNEDKEADETKISAFAELILSVARREPPKGSSGKRSLDDDGGIAKYLPKK